MSSLAYLVLAEAVIIVGVMLFAIWYLNEKLQAAIARLEQNKNYFLEELRTTGTNNSTPILNHIYEVKEEMRQELEAFESGTRQVITQFSREVKALEDFHASEKFLDAVVERLIKKQLR